MSTIEDNKAVCRKFHVSIMEGKFDDAANLVAEDAVWWVQGNMVVSGFHRGRDAIKALLEPLKALPYGVRFEFGAVTAEADRVSVEMVAHAKLGEGREYNNTYHFLFTVKDGLIVQCKEYLDTKATYEALFQT
jgi:ketosteroid isomerase-like protein